MSDNKNHTTLYLGGPIENAAETACLRRLRKDLEAFQLDAVLIANITLGPKRRQIDLIVATATAAVVVEIKGYVHAVRGGLNGPWTLDLGNSRKSLGATNPYQQTLNNRYAVADALAARARVDGNAIKNAVSGMLCLFPLPVPGTQIPASDFKVAIGGYPDLIDLLTKPSSSALPLSDWRRLAQELGLEDAAAAPATFSETIIGEYLTAFTNLARATAGPYIEPKFDGDYSTAALAAQIGDGAQIQIVGPSGSGKTELLSALAQAVAEAGSLPIPVRAGDFEKQLAPLLQTSIARCSPIRTAAFLEAARQAGAEIILFVDGINECPPVRRSDLIAALQAARIKYDARIVLASQEPTSLPAILAGTEIRLVQPDSLQSERLVAAHLGRPLTPDEVGAVEVVATAQDAAVLAAIMDRPGTIDGRFALYYSFIQARLEAFGRSQTDRSLSVLASAMRATFVASMTRAAAEHILNAHDPAAAATARGAGLIRVEGNRLTFRHDLIADFFAADDILRRAVTPTELGLLARQPINAELREFLLGGCATTIQIDALIGKEPDPRLLRGALSGRAGNKALNYVVDRLRDLIGQLKQCFCRITLSLPEGVTSARELRSLIPSFPEDLGEELVDRTYLQLIPSALSHEGLIEELLALFASVDARLATEAERLRSLHPNVRVAWRAAAYGAVYGVHYYPGGHELQELLSAIQNAWFREAERVPDLGLRHRLDAFESLSVGQLFLLTAAMRSARNEPLPFRFPELLRHIWGLRVYHLRLYICDIVRFRGSELPPEQRQLVRDALNEWLSNTDIFVNSIIIDALEGVEGIEAALTVEEAVREYESMLDIPETPESRRLAIGAVTQTYDHPFRDIYWEAFYEVLAVEKRQALLLRGLRDETSDPWSIDDILRALRREPTPEAAPELQRLAQVPRVDGHSSQHAILVYASAIELLASLSIPLTPPQPAPDTAGYRAWACAAPLIYVLNAGSPALSGDMASQVAQFLACGAANAFDVVQQLTREVSNLRHPANVAFENLWPDMILNLCRAVLSPGYTATSIFERLYFSRTLADDHYDFALAMMAKVGRRTDLTLVSAWLDHPGHGERALATARALERQID